MVHYDPLRAAPTPPQVCPKCGSHRTEVVGITDSPPTLVLRCNACGAVSTVSINQDSAPTQPHIEEDVNVEIDVIRAVGRAMALLPDEDAQQRVLRWINDRFQSSPAGPSAPRPGPGSRVDDVALGMDGVKEFFDSAATRMTMHCEAVDAEESLDELFEPAVATPAVRREVRLEAVKQEAGTQEEPGLDSLVRGFVSDFQRIALEWQGA